MKENVTQFLMGASIAIGTSAIASAPALAYTLTGNDDYFLFKVCSPNFTCLSQNAEVNALLAGNSSAPGGNVELFASSESVSLSDFLNSDARTNIERTVAGKQVVVSSLTAKDWFGAALDTSYGASTFATQWFNEFYQESGLATNELGIRFALSARTGDSSWLRVPSAAVREVIYNVYLSDQIRGFQRSSDPNVSYIATSGSDLLIGLAGHYDTKAFYEPILGPLAALIEDGFQVSEVVKVNYGGVEELLYSFNATPSGLGNHTGNYEVKIENVVTDVPEPSIVLGLMGLGGFFVARRKSRK